MRDVCTDSHLAVVLLHQGQHRETSKYKLNIFQYGYFWQNDSYNITKSTAWEITEEN